MLNTDKDTKKIKVEWVIFFLLLSVFLILLSIFLQGKKKSPQTQPTLANPNVIPLPTGVQYFNISYGDEKNNKPKISYIKVNPLNATTGMTQSISFKATSPFPVVQIASILYSDVNKNILSFSLTEGTVTDGVWSATWNVNDTLNKRYKIELHIVNKEDFRDDEITFR